MQPHMRLFSIGTLINQFRCCMTMDRIMHFILHFCKEIFCCQCITVIVQSCCIDVGKLLIEIAFRDTNFPDTLQLLFKILFCQNCTAIFQAFFIHCPALDRVLLYDLVCPNTKAYCPLVVYFEPDCNNRLQIIMIRVVLFSVRGSY